MKAYYAIECPNWVMEKTVRRALGGHGNILCRVRSPNGLFGKRCLHWNKAALISRYAFFEITNRSTRDIIHHGFRGASLTPSL